MVVTLMVQRGGAMAGSGRVDCAPTTLLFYVLLQVGGVVAENSWCVKIASVLIYPKQKSSSMAPVPLQSRPKVLPSSLVSICLGFKTKAK